MNVTEIVNLCRDNPRSNGEPQYPNTEFVGLPEEDNYYYSCSIETLTDDTSFIHDFNCPPTLMEMMIIVHDVRNNLRYGEQSYETSQARRLRDLSIGQRPHDTPTSSSSSSVSFSTMTESSSNAPIAKTRRNDYI